MRGKGYYDTYIYGMHGTSIHECSAYNVYNAFKEGIGSSLFQRDPRLPCCLPSEVKHNKRSCVTLPSSHTINL